MKRILFLLCCIIPLIGNAQTTLETLNNMHQVVKGETLWSIAHKYGVSEEALKKANPQIKKNKVKRGTFLVIPRVVEQPPIVMTPVMEVPTKPAEPAAIEKRVLRVGVLLPLEEKTERGTKLVEFYQGFLMAVDSVKSEGANLTIHTFHSGSTAESMQHLLRNDALADMDIIFGPADAAQVEPLSEFCNRAGVRLVIPFANNSNLSGKPLTYSATASGTTVMKDAACLIVSQRPDHNYVILNTNNSDTRGQQFVEAIRNELARRGIAMRAWNIEGDELAIESALNQFRPNCIIPDNTSIKTLNVLFARLNNFCAEHPDYKISIQGYPEWQTYTSSQLLDFYKYDTYIYSPYYRNPLLAQTENFEQRFSTNFRHPQGLSFPRYGMMGFDMGYYFLHGLWVLGNRFEDAQSTLQYEPVQHSFKFTRDEDNSGFTNHGIQLIHYTPEQTIEQIRPR
ncbi:MAG: LysM peptidoglycan-binding domain-containing protein [Bacteroidaceae bacterium]|nr:LysM peptidoglycan-binding domain-containing protein [Bacteroidaceae bacterium]